MLGLEFFYVAFMDLTTCRQLTQHGEGPIAWTSIDRYCEFYNVLGEQREDVFYHIQHLDKAYLDWSRKRMERQLKNNTPKTPVRKR